MSARAKRRWPVATTGKPNWPTRWPLCAGDLKRAAEAAGRNVDEIELLPITKFFPATDVLILTRLGCPHSANRANKKRRKKSAECRRRDAARADSLAHGRPDPAQQGALDRGLGTCRALGRQRQADRRTGPGRRPGAGRRPARPSRCGSTSRSVSTATSIGAASTSAAPTWSTRSVPPSQAAEGLDFVGLMGIPPLDADPAEAFARLQAEQQRVQRAYAQPLGLSAGMSDDLEIAVKHGSTCVRVGTALMGQRPLTSP